MNAPLLPKSLLIPLLLMALALLLLLAIPQRAAAQAASGTTGGSMLLWPVHPVIEADERAAALWLENPGKAPVTLQVRIYAWAQQDGTNVYAAQDAILGTPPIATIAPGEKQLVRLTRTLATAPGTEAAYRVVVDEIPVAKPAGETGAAVSFRMRYSLPLFAYGKGLASPGAADRGKRRPQAAPAPLLSWRTGQDGEGRYLEIHNDGIVHARLTDVAFSDGPAASGGQIVAKGLLGYVLPGAAMRWPIATSAGGSATLVASVNGAPAAPVARRAD